jgi:Xaa-Pro aminopeptidase
MHAGEIAQLDYGERISRAVRLMVAEGLDALILSRPSESRSLFYLTGADRLCANLVIYRDGGSTLLILEEDLLDAKTTAHADEVKTFTSARSQFEAIANALKEHGLSRGVLGVEKHFIHVGFYENLRAALPAPLQITDATKVTGQLRLIKTEDEITLIRKASAIATKALESATETVRPGTPENEIAATVEYELRRNGAEATAMSTFIASGPRTQAAHPPPSSRKLQRSEVVLIDLHPRIQGYCSDLAATFTVSTEDTGLTGQLRRSLEARDSSIQELRIGDRFSTIHLGYLRRLSNYGFTVPSVPFFNNLHGVGVSANDPPSFWHPTDVEIQPGMVFALAQCPVQPQQIEAVGMRFEDTYLVTESGVERLTSPQNQ